MFNLHGELVGDVVYALRPEFDGAHGKQLPSVSFGIGGQHSTFILSGAGVQEGIALQGQVRVVDVAPTLCYLLGLPMPDSVEGGCRLRGVKRSELASDPTRSFRITQVATNKILDP